MQPAWYAKLEAWLLEKGTPTISALLLVVILVSLFLLVAVAVKRRNAVPAAAWLTYLFMP